MTFDPLNPYRRKSSLTTSEAETLHSQRRARRDECIVHDFLESQRRAAGAAEVNGTDTFLGHPSYASAGPATPAATPAATPGVGRGPILDAAGVSLGEPKHHRRRRSKCIVDPGSLDGQELGQPDQQAWTREMTRSTSELDVKSYDDAHSRTLTKKQLSDMAWGVRELSRRLSSMRIRVRVKTVFVLTKVYDYDLIPKTRDLTKWLLDKERDVPCIVYIQDKLKTNKKFDLTGLLDDVAKRYSDDGEVSHEKALGDIKKRLRFWDEDMCKTRPHTFDFVITLGGDGTVLYASWLFQRIVPPVLSFALGSLGFLTKFDFDEFPTTLNSAFNKGVTVSLRLRFEGTVMRSQKKASPELESGSSEEDDGEHHARRDLVEELIGEEKDDVRTHRPDGTFEILNEIVVDRGPNPSMCLLCPS